MEQKDIEVDFYSVFFISYKLVLEIMFYYRTDLNTHRNGFYQFKTL